MKKLASILLTAAMLSTMLTVFAVPAFAEGEPGDSADNPILVTNANWSSLYNKLQAGKYYKLVEDIGSENKKIGKGIGNVPEGTHFDGNGYTVWISCQLYW